MEAWTRRAPRARGPGLGGWVGGWVSFKLGWVEWSDGWVWVGDAREDGWMNGVGGWVGGRTYQVCLGNAAHVNQPLQSLNDLHHAAEDGVVLYWGGRWVGGWVGGLGGWVDVNQCLNDFDHAAEDGVVLYWVGRWVGGLICLLASAACSFPLVRRING